MKMYIPTGISDYKKLRIEDYYTVDKTLMIQEFLERRSAVTLITRPRRFGKTLNMSMMAEFFDITKDSKALFEGLAIMNTEYAKEMNQYPVVFLSFANAKGNLKETVKFMKLQLQYVFDKYSFVFEKLTLFQKTEYENIVMNLIQLDDGRLDGINNALIFLMKKLNDYYCKRAMLLVDEYDTPFIEAHVNNYYNEIHDGLASLLRTSLKDNEYLQYAMLTGIQRVAKENIFSDLNNVKVYGVTSIPYSQYFGFTKEETQAILTYYGLEYSEEVKQMYDGYRFGDQDIYNPWSIINYAQDGKLEPYWVNTSGNKMIKEAMRKTTGNFKSKYEALIENGTIETRVNIATSFYEEANSDSLWGLFVNAGYLTILESVQDKEDTYLLRIPNQEVLKEFKSLTAYHLNVEVTELEGLYYGLIEKDKERFIQSYEHVLLANPSFYDLKNENSYAEWCTECHMLLLGICLYIKNDYTLCTHRRDVLSNRETGKGRSDIILKAKRNDLPSYVIEMKYTNDIKKLKSLLNKGESQINKSRYDYDLKNEVIHIVIAHCSKDIAVNWIELLRN